MATIIGTFGDDTLTGDGEDDLITGLTGDDEIEAGGGNDDVFGGIGEDDIRGQNGDDLLDGGLDDDTIRGGRGEDEIYGGFGDDNIRGGRDDDYVSGGAGDDTIRGGTGDDTYRGGTGDDTFVFSYDADSGEVQNDEVEDFSEGGGFFFGLFSNGNDELRINVDNNDGDIFAERDGDTLNIYDSVDNTFGNNDDVLLGTIEFASASVVDDLSESDLTANSDDVTFIG